MKRGRGQPSLVKKCASALDELPDELRKPSPAGPRDSVLECGGPPCTLLMRRWDARPSRSAPVLGRSNERMPKGLGKPVRLGAIRRCCARGRAHSAVAYPAALAVMSSILVKHRLEAFVSGQDAGKWNESHGEFFRKILPGQRCGHGNRAQPLGDGGGEHSGWVGVGAFHA